MSTLKTIQSTDVIADSRQDINDNFTELNTDKVETLADLGLTGTAADYNNALTWAPRLVPAGAVTMNAGSTTPTGWLECEGQAVSRSTYADLFAAVGTTYGVGDGSTTFNLPNLQGRVPVGVDTGQTEFDALGETGGAKTHTLTTAQIPAHTHTLPSYQNTNTASSNLNGLANTTGTQNTHTTSSVGGGEAHNNLQPYITLNFIIKT
jgi:microcystin-dependent protein